MNDARRIGSGKQPGLCPLAVALFAALTVAGGGAAACTNNFPDCDDGRTCTLDSCVDGACIHEPVICPLDDLCQNPVCDDDYGCISLPLICPQLPGYDVTCHGGVCEITALPLPCDDQDPCTLDEQVSDGAGGTTCKHVPRQCDTLGNCLCDGQPCGPPDCDHDLCTTDTCDLAGRCVSTPIECHNSNCWGVRDECVEGVCQMKLFTDPSECLCGGGEDCTKGRPAVLNGEGTAYTCDSHSPLETSRSCDEHGNCTCGGVPCSSDCYTGIDACTTGAGHCEGTQCVTTELDCDDHDASTPDACRCAGFFCTPCSPNDCNYGPDCRCGDTPACIHTGVIADPAGDSCSLPGASGWCRGIQTARFRASDTYGVESPCTAAPDVFCTFTRTSITNGAAITIGSGEVCRTLPYCSIDEATAGPYRIDSVGPRLACPTAAPLFALGKPGAGVTAAVSDTTSGAASATASAPANTSAPGMFSATVTGFDVAGNGGSATCPYTVASAFLGFTAPLPKTKLASASSTIPVKFRLGTYQGVALSDVAAAAIPTKITISANVDGSSALSTASCTYSTENHLYQCNLKTPARLLLGTTHPYYITAYETVGSGYVKPPLAQFPTTTNPEIVYFK